MEQIDIIVEKVKPQLSKENNEAIIENLAEELVDLFYDPSDYLNVLKKHPHLTRKDDQQRRSHPKKPMHDQDGCWSCMACDNINYPRRVTCHMCSSNRDYTGTEIVKRYVMDLILQRWKQGSIDTPVYKNALKLKGRAISTSFNGLPLATAIRECRMYAQNNIQVVFLDQFVAQVSLYGTPIMFVFNNFCRLSPTPALSAFAVMVINNLLNHFNAKVRLRLEKGQTFVFNMGMREQSPFIPSMCVFFPAPLWVGNPVGQPVQYYGAGSPSGSMYPVQYPVAPVSAPAPMHHPYHRLQQQPQPQYPSTPNAPPTSFTPTTSSSFQRTLSAAPTTSAATPMDETPLRMSLNEEALIFSKPPTHYIQRSDTLPEFISNPETELHTRKERMVKALRQLNISPDSIVPDDSSNMSPLIASNDTSGSTPIIETSTPDLDIIRPVRPKATQSFIPSSNNKGIINKNNSESGSSTPRSVFSNKNTIGSVDNNSVKDELDEDDISIKHGESSSSRILSSSSNESDDWLTQLRKNGVTDTFPTPASSTVRPPETIHTISAEELESMMLNMEPPHRNITL